MYVHVIFDILCDRLESDEEAGEQLIADIFGASDEEEEFVVRFTGYQARIQDFEMGGEFSPPQSEKSEKSNIISIFEG